MNNYNRFKNLEIDDDEDDILFISLGQQCGVAYNLEKYGYKSESLPFDWIRTPNFPSIVKLIENKFSDFLNEIELEYNDNPEVKFYFRNKITRCEFVHECEETDFNTIKEKYNRRIKRFYKKLTEYKKIIFIRDIYRHNYSKNYIDAASINSFTQIIKQINKDLKFCFFIVYKEDIISNKIISSIKEKVLPNIIFIQDKTYGRYWKRDQFNWNELFEKCQYYFDNPQSFHTHELVLE